MSKGPFVIFGILAVLAGVLIPFLAINDEGGGDVAAQTVASEYKQGQELFQINCGTCHTLEAAGTDGLVGPNLDTLLVGNPPQSESEATVKANRSRVLSAVEHGVNGRMPAGILQGEQAKTVADFVANNLQYVGTPAPAPAPAPGG